MAANAYTDIPGTTTLPPAVRAVRILLRTIGGLTLMTALDVWLVARGSYGFGAALVLLPPAVASLAVARHVAVPRRRTESWINGLGIVYVLWQLSRIPDGDPFVLLGLAFPTAVLVLGTGSAARRHFRWEGRTNPMPRRTAVLARRDRGESSISYIAVVLLIVTLIVALVASDLPTQVSGRIEAGVCKVTGDNDCAPDKTTKVTGRGPDTTGPQSGATPDGGGGDGGHDGNCYDLLDWACGLTDGLRRGTWNAATDLWDGGAFVACLVHLCSNSGFVDNWKGIGNLIAHPIDSAKSMWEEATKPIRDDWNNGHKWRAAGIAVPTVLGKVFGRKGLDVPKFPKGRHKNGGIPDRKSFIDLTHKIDEEIYLGGDAALRGDIRTAEVRARTAEQRIEEARADGAGFPEESHRVDNVQFWLDRLKSEILIRKVILETPGGKEATDILVKHGIRIDATHDRDRYVTYRRPVGAQGPTLDIDNNHGRSGPVGDEYAKRLAPLIIDRLDQARRHDELRE